MGIPSFVNLTPSTSFDVKGVPERYRDNDSLVALQYFVKVTLPFDLSIFSRDRTNPRKSQRGRTISSLNATDSQVTTFKVNQDKLNNLLLFFINLVLF
jgi:hypothetical protein